MWTRKKPKCQTCLKAYCSWLEKNRVEGWYRKPSWAFRKDLIKGQKPQTRQACLLSFAGLRANLDLIDYKLAKGLFSRCLCMCMCVKTKELWGGSMDLMKLPEGSSSGTFCPESMSFEALVLGLKGVAFICPFFYHPIRSGEARQKNFWLSEFWHEKNFLFVGTHHARTHKFCFLQHDFKPSEAITLCAQI